ncbi:MAG: CehA/McbA family metallohydrolase [Firmicutes bacterium]|jgi:hypothetical protein|nr:CehA/McbA family metallohydrolase [Bacillota bacterium]
MARESVYCKDNKWFKGNLHSHTTRSDGRLSPPEVAEIYRTRGWNFLAITDHDLYSYWEELNTDDFIIIPGIEIEVKIPKPWHCHHIVGIHRTGRGARHLERIAPPEGIEAAGAQAAIDNFQAENYLSIYCHPLWSRVEWEDVSELRNFTAIEIYNHGCERENRTGLHLDHWDSFLRRGVKVWGVATDDTHQWDEDYCGGWIMVNAPQLTVEDISKAIEAGRFYSSTGPVITDFGLDGGQVYIECSPAAAIHFVAFESRGKSFYAEPGETISSAVHNLRGDELFVRAEVVDANGRTAWTNPIFFNR